MTDIYLLASVHMDLLPICTHYDSLRLDITFHASVDCTHGCEKCLHVGAAGSIYFYMHKIFEYVNTVLEIILQ